MWKCPECQSTTHLRVEVKVDACLIQQSEDDNFETDADGSHEWGDESDMRCTNCGHYGTAGSFEVNDDD